MSQAVLVLVLVLLVEVLLGLVLSFLPWNTSLVVSDFP